MFFYMLQILNNSHAGDLPSPEEGTESGQRQFITQMSLALVLLPVRKLASH